MLDVISNGLGDILIAPDLNPPSVELIVICSANPILYKRPEIRKFLCIEMGPDSSEHVPPAIEYAMAFRER